MSNHGVSVVTGQALSAPSGRVADERPHKCAKCFNPFTQAGNPECVKAKEQGND